MTDGRSITEIAAGVVAEEAERGSRATETARAKAISAMGGALRRRQRYRRLRWLAAGSIGIAAAAAVALLLLLGSRTHGPSAPVARPARASVVVGGEAPRP